jgi:hypothetical protein
MHTLTESIFDGLPMHAKKAHKTQCAAAQQAYVDKLQELEVLQRSKLTKTVAGITAAREDLAITLRQLADLEAEELSWGPSSSASLGGGYGAGSHGQDEWDSYVWDYSTMSWVWKTEEQPQHAAPPAAPALALTDPYLQSDQELSNNLLQLLSQVHAHAPSSNAWALAEGLQRQAARQSSQGAHRASAARAAPCVKTEPVAAAPSPTASQASTVHYSPAHHPFRATAAAAPMASLPAALSGATPAPGPAPSLQARAKAAPAPRPTGRLIPAKRGGRPVAKRVGVASPARAAAAAVDLQKVRVGAAEVILIDDGDMSADEGFVAGLLAAPRAAAFPQAAVEAAPALA